MPRASVLLVIALLLAGSDAAAQQESASAPASPAERAAAAQALFNEGMQRYQRGSFDEAIAAFTEAFKLAAEPIIVFNLAVTYRKKGDCANALYFYREYLKVEKQPRDRAKVEERITEMARCVADQRRPRAASPPVAVETSRPPPRRPWGRVAAIVVTGAGLALAATGGVLLGTAKSRFDELQGSCAPDCPPSSWDGYETRTTAGNVLVVTGAVVLAGGVIWWVLASRQPRPESRAWLVPGPMGVLAGGVF